MKSQDQKKIKWLKAYYKNRDVINERSKQYHKTNRKSLNLYKKLWLDSNPNQKEKARQRIKNWRLKNVIFYSSQTSPYSSGDSNSSNSFISSG